MYYYAIADSILHETFSSEVARQGKGANVVEVLPTAADVDIDAGPPEVERC